MTTDKQKEAALTEAGLPPKGGKMRISATIDRRIIARADSVATEAGMSRSELLEIGLTRVLTDYEAALRRAKREGRENANS